MYYTNLPFIIPIPINISLITEHLLNNGHDTVISSRNTIRGTRYDGREYICTYSNTGLLMKLSYDLWELKLVRDIDILPIIFAGILIISTSISFLVYRRYKLPK
ncbi:MAG: hypothetical protein KGD63_01900 [Candidatus Lokiarchaeota archaeon]|nr:hypothetical protein [Candidatus Lokiarchaeota archaeon]